MKDEIKFLNPTKYARCVQLFRKEGVKDPTTEQILERYIGLAGAYEENGEIKNVIGNPNFKAKEAEVLAALPKLRNPKPTRKRSKK